MRKLIAILFFGMFFTQSFAQELNCKVKVNDAQVQVSDKRIFREMENTFAQFLNNRKWTNDDFNFNEKIDCNVLITINEMPSIGNFNGSIIIQSARPIFNTAYSSNLFTFVDRDFNFYYIESQPLDFNINNFNSNLTSILGFYAYVILGMDYDSFKPMGGTYFFEQARSIARIAQQSGFPGWDRAGGGNAARNRGALIESIFNTQMQPIRETIYEYHRLALDTFTEDPEAGRKLVLENLKKLKEVRDINPSAIFLISFFDAKADEIANMFSQGEMAVRRQAYDLLTRIDPGNIEKYKRITK